MNSWFRAVTSMSPLQYQKQLRLQEARHMLVHGVSGFRHSEPHFCADAHFAIYSASKAAIHAFTLSLRAQVKNTNVRVFELAPPGTDTPLFWGDFTKEDLGGAKPMPVQILVKQAIAGMKKNVLEIRPGLANALRLGGRLAPNFMLGQLSKSVDLLLVEVKS